MFQDIFSKVAATKHRPWDCVIDILPGTKLPKGKIYSLSIPEHKAMDEYIKKALRRLLDSSSRPRRMAAFNHVLMY